MKLSVKDLGYDVLSYDFSMNRRNAAHISNSNEIQSKCKIVSLLKVLKSKITMLIPSEFKFLLKFPLKLFYAFRDLDPTIDVALVGGGQLVLSNKTFSSSMLSWVLVCKVRKVPVCLIGVGVGSEFSKLDSILFKISLSLVDKVYVRDFDSRDLLHKWFGFEGALYAPDSVYCLCDVDKFSNHPRQCSTVLIAPVEYGVHLRYFDEIGSIKKTPEDYSKYWVEIIEKYSREYNDVVITSTTNADFIFSSYLYSTLKDKLSSIRIIECQSWHDYMSLVESSDLVVSGRMHALIIGQIAGAKVNPIVMSKKLKVFSDTLNSYDVVELKTLFLGAVEECLDSVH